jgi:hypothetical protein
MPVISELIGRNETEILHFYDVAFFKGGAMWKRLRSFNVSMSTAKTLDNCGYLIDEGNLRPNAIAAVKMKLASAGLTIGTLRYVDIRPVGTNIHDDAAYSNWFDVEHGIIICNEMPKLAIRIPQKCRYILPTSFGNVINVLLRPRGPNASFRPSRFNIINHNSQDAIFSARMVSTSLREDAYGHVEYNFLDPGFYAILGTRMGLARSE